MKTKVDTALRIATGVLVWVLTFAIAVRCADERERKRHARYEKCVSEGYREITCSFRAAFEGDE